MPTDPRSRAGADAGRLRGLLTFARLHAGPPRRRTAAQGRGQGEAGRACGCAISPELPATSRPWKTAVDRTLAALLHGIEDNPLEIAVEVGEQGAPGPRGTVARPHPPADSFAQARDPEPRRDLRGKPAPDGFDPRRGGPLRSCEAGGRGRSGFLAKEVLNALGQFYVYTLTLQLPPGNAPGGAWGCATRSPRPPPTSARPSPWEPPASAKAEVPH